MLRAGPASPYRLTIRAILHPALKLTDNVGQQALPSPIAALQHAQEPHQRVAQVGKSQPHLFPELGECRRTLLCPANARSPTGPAFGTRTPQP